MDRKRIPTLTDDLRKAWKHIPEMRLGQMIANLLVGPSTAEQMNDLYYVTDEALLKRVKELAKFNSKAWGGGPRKGNNILDGERKALRLLSGHAEFVSVWMLLFGLVLLAGVVVALFICSRQLFAVGPIFRSGVVLVPEPCFSWHILEPGRVANDSPDVHRLKTLTDGKPFLFAQTSSGCRSYCDRSTVRGYDHRQGDPFQIVSVWNVLKMFYEGANAGPLSDDGRKAPDVRKSHGHVWLVKAAPRANFDIHEMEECSLRHDERFLGYLGAGFGGGGSQIGGLHTASQERYLPYSEDQQDNRDEQRQIVESVALNIQPRKAPDGYRLLAWIVFVNSCCCGCLISGVFGVGRLSDGRRGGALLILCAACLGITGLLSSIVERPWWGWWL